MKKKEEKKESEGNWVKELCGDDDKLYDLLSSSLYMDPASAIPKADLESLVEEAETNIKDENFQNAMRKYRTLVNKALFEATQNPEERARYIKTIQDLVSRTLEVIEKVKENREKEGFVSSSLEGRIKHYEYMSERIEDMIKTASLFYNERLEVIGAKERREARRKDRVSAEFDEQREEKEEKEKREARRKDMSGRERREAEKEDKIEEKKVRNSRRERRKEAKEAEREEDRIEQMEKERRETRRKEK